MKQHHLYLTIRVTVDSKLSNLSETVQEFEQETKYQFSGTKNITVIETEILTTAPFNPLN
ncbi:MAG: hypothetical protein V4594_21695 [Bacteroidota bacterium]